MNAIHAVWSEVRVPQLNRLLKNFGVRLIQTRSKKWGDKSTITGSYLEGGLPSAAKLIVEEKEIEKEALNRYITTLINRNDALISAISNIEAEFTTLNGPECKELMLLVNQMRPKPLVAEEALELN